MSQLLALDVCLRDAFA
nr:DUF645 family protein [Vibrio cholerae]